MISEATVVIPVRDDRDGIARCLDALADQRDVDLEVIVVDDGSTDGTAEVASSRGVNVLCGGGSGAGAARNRGVLAATRPVILFTDGDCAPDPEWARRLLDAMSDPNVVAAKGTYRTEQPEPMARFVQVEYEERYARMRERETIDFLDTYSLAVRRDDFLAIGGFDESFTGASVEDQEMSFRLVPRGRCLFVEDAIVAHRHADSIPGYARKKFRIGRGKATVLRRHRDRHRSDSHTPEGLRLQVAATALGYALIPFSALHPLIALCVGLALLSPIAGSLPLVGRTVRREGYGFLPFALTAVLVRGHALTLGLVRGVISPAVQLGDSVESCIPSDEGVAKRPGEPADPDGSAEREVAHVG